MKQATHGSWTQDVAMEIIRYCIYYDSFGSSPTTTFRKISSRPGVVHGRTRSAMDGGDRAMFRIPRSLYGRGQSASRQATRSPGHVLERAVRPTSHAASSPVL